MAVVGVLGVTHGKSGWTRVTAAVCFPPCPEPRESGMAKVSPLSRVLDVRERVVRPGARRLNERSTAAGTPDA